MATLQKKISRGHTYWQIVESRRVNGKPRPIVLMHLGSAEGLLRRLKEGAGKPIKARVMQCGAVSALWELANKIDIVGIIDRHVNKRHQGLSCGQYILLAAINRCVSTTSKSSLYDWYHNTILQRLIPTSKKSLTSQRFWDHMNYLDAQTIKNIEDEIVRKLIADFDIDIRTLIFDATNFDTFIDTQNPCQLPQRGHAKSKRFDLRILGLALLVSTDFHIPLMSHVYPGNQNDSKMFSQVTQGLIFRYRQLVDKCDDITLVFDGGNTSKKNMKKIEQSPYHFITSLTLTHHSDLLEIPASKYSSFENERLKGTTAFRTQKKIWDKEYTIVITRSEKLYTGQMAGILKALEKKSKQLNELTLKLERSQMPKAPGKYTRESLEKKINTTISGQYISKILKAEIKESNGKLTFSFFIDHDAFDELKNNRLGKRILCTDKHDWSTEEIIIGSRAQYHIEKAFRQMKNPHWVSFSPSFHWTDQKLRVHAFYCILSLLLCSLLQRKAAEDGINITINELLKQLSEVTEVINLYSSSQKNGKGRLRSEYVLSERSPLQEKLCKIFDVHKHVKK